MLIFLFCFQNYSFNDDEFSNLSNFIDLPFVGGIKYTCSFADCGLQFKRKDQLDSHEYSHSSIKKFQCSEADCTKSYVNNAHLQRHIRKTHQKATSHQLHYCRLDECTHPISEEVYVRKQREYECAYCSMKFTRKFKLRLHIFTHTGNYEYKCQKCDKGFVRMSQLKQHEKIHDERKCDQCDQVFTKWSLLMVHKRNDHTNNENKCLICGKVFRSKRGLKYHSKVHTELDNRIIYQCTYESCPKFFLQRKSMLAHHKSKHENQKFICSVDGCGRELSTKQKLNMHMNAVHCDETRNRKIHTKSSKPKAKRKDKGKQKVSTASKLFNLVLPNEIEQAIISGNGNKIYFNYESKDFEDGDADINTDEVISQSQINEKPNEIECCN